MIISRSEIASAISAYKSVKRKSTVRTVAFDTDRFDASEAAASLVGFVQAVTAEPLYRTALVDDLQRRISEGRYYVPSEEIVDKLLGRLIVEVATA